MRVLLDTEVILDVIMAREPFANVAAELLDLSEQGQFDAFISAITPINIFYIARKAKSKTDLRQTVIALLNTLQICPIDYSTLIEAFDLQFSDYEDATQCACAVANQLDAIVTRNVTDYRLATLPIFTPTEFLNRMRLEQADEPS